MDGTVLWLVAILMAVGGYLLWKYKKRTPAPVVEESTEDQVASTQYASSSVEPRWRRSLFSLRHGDEVTCYDIGPLTVVGKMRLLDKLGTGLSTRRYTLHDGETQYWLLAEQSEDGGAQVTLWQALKFRGEAPDQLGEHLVLGDQSYVRVSDRSYWHADGGQEKGGNVQIIRYRTTDGTYLAFVRFDDSPWVVTRGRQILLDHLTLHIKSR